ncbi:gamma-glutamylcyclotransferase family protein [Vibrio rhizosphaerae]|uniref:Gamma-glutamylcyclotransferase family protein n=1 Tax=Vibrio rhizosphaerae TaxID=398736 RepID=A0ABU4IWA5_9VIBR|nr:gamma-glutamylcyclotransferase family protein [Vibrio rhizosphaerae]MDW6093686.1 gamma-glutamylcyclotransferase family protein [Vibrio rhizosphaerae]
MYIFGYGSLMNSSSRQLTGQTGTACPAVVEGLTRTWGKVDDSYQASPLVAQPGDGIVNGVLLHVSPKELAQFDQRERGYHRIQLTLTNIETELPLTAQDAVWVYVKNEPMLPSHESPILQTYIDTVLTGCLEVSEAFADLFVQHTNGWEHPLENDRHAPKYVNYAGIHPEHWPKIDQILTQVFA